MGTQQIWPRVLGKGLCASFSVAVILQEPEKVQAEKQQVSSQVIKSWILKKDLFRKARTDQRSDGCVQIHGGESTGLLPGLLEA